MFRYLLSNVSFINLTDILIIHVLLWVMGLFFKCLVISGSNCVYGGLSNQLTGAINSAFKGQKELFKTISEPI